ncbi:MAG: response regulator [Planctomycetota bacterium]
MIEAANRRILVVDDTDSIHVDFLKILAGPPAPSVAATAARAAFFGSPATPAPAAAPADAYEVESARQGQEALGLVERAVAQKRPYALAFMDVRMPPGWDGIETIQHLWRVDPELQVVICSAYADYSWAEMIARLGRTDRLLFLRKPFDPVEISQLASALTEKWNVHHREKARMEEARRAEMEARSYAASLATMNNALETAKARAEAAARAKSEFLANMSHEIRTPMIAILGYADLLRDRSISPALREEHLDTIHASGRRLLGILEGILDMARIETGRLEIEVKTCPIGQIVQEVVASHREQAQQKGLELTFLCEEGLPETIESDPARVRQIAAVMVGNAIKFTNQGFVRISLGLEGVAAGEAARIRLQVTDTGIGITPEVRARMFEPFSPGDSSMTREQGGAGLGLALAKRLSQMLGGDLVAESRSGDGACFTLHLSARLPAPRRTLRAADGLPAGANAAKAAGSDARPSLRGSVLLVEDAPVTQRLHAQILKNAGAEVGIAQNGRVAREKALQAEASGRPYDLILMDMQMPVMDGYEATRELRARGYRGPIVAVTAHANSGDRERCLECGCDDYLAKPVDRAAFLELCRRWIDSVSPPAPLPSRGKSKGSADEASTLQPETSDSDAEAPPA